MWSQNCKSLVAFFFFFFFFSFWGGGLCLLIKEGVHYQIYFSFIADSDFGYQSTAIHKKIVLRFSFYDMIKLRRTIVPCQFYEETKYISNPAKWMVVGSRFSIAIHAIIKIIVRTLIQSSGICWDHLRFYSVLTSFIH